MIRKIAIGLVAAAIATAGSTLSASAFRGGGGFGHGGGGFGRGGFGGGHFGRGGFGRGHFGGHRICFGTRAPVVRVHRRGFRPPPLGEIAPPRHRVRPAIRHR